MRTFFMTESDNLKESTLQKLVAKLINGTQAAEVLQLSTRQVRRLKKRFVKKGIKGILHQSRGTVSSHAVPKAVKKEIIKLIKTNYPDFGRHWPVRNYPNFIKLTFPMRPSGTL